MMLRRSLPRRGSQPTVVDRAGRDRTRAATAHSGRNPGRTPASTGVAGSSSPATAPAESSSPVDERSAPPGKPVAAGRRRATRPPSCGQAPPPRVRLQYLMQAWSVSLVVHVAILSALAAATSLVARRAQRIVNFDSALAHTATVSRRCCRSTPTPTTSRRDKAIGDEHADDSGRAGAVVVGEGEADEDGGGGVIVAGRGHRPALDHPEGPGAGKGRINEGYEPARRQDRRSGRLALACCRLPPAADLGGGGKIAGDPIFDVKEIGVALDQLAREILRHLKDHKLTVVWLFDESISMQDDQKTILEKFDRVSSELKLNVEPNKKTAGALNHAIVGFGQAIDYMLEKPREDIDQIGRAIKNLQDRLHRHREHDEGDPRGRRALRRADPRRTAGS